MGSQWITFLTDYGLEDNFVGVCHGVLATIAPDARVLDITHLIPRGNVARGAEVLRQSIRYLPRAVHLAVVDPGVGTARKAVVLAAGDQLLVGPDNGLLIPAAEELGGVDAAFEAANPGYFLADVSATFHGRDVFSPAAAHLSAGIPPAELGPAIDPGTLVRLPAPVRETVGDGGVRGQVVLTDRFGNLQTSLDRAFLTGAGIAVGADLRLRAGDGAGDDVVVLPYVHTFGSVPEGRPLAHIDSSGRLALAVNLGSAEDTFGLTEGAVFTLTRTLLSPPDNRPGE
ncbi:MAG: SAM-dependent chlorinase/fluorinase [Nocardiopsaceae bacterium]|nr:SAM-dependent chlorinase/fluorinase [Nocardiopsaceae bacterium]